MRFLHTFTVNPESEEEEAVAAALAAASTTAGGKMAAAMSGPESGVDPLGIGWPPRSGEVSPAFFARKVPALELWSPDYGISFLAYSFVNLN